MPVTRERSGSIQIDDIKALLQQLEERLTSRISQVFSKMEDFEKSMQLIQANQVRLDNEMNSMKEVIIVQQKQIEKIEAEKRQNNVVIHGVPEEEISVNDLVLKSDTQKVAYLSNIIDPADKEAPIDFVTRLGPKTPGRRRHLLVSFSNKSDRNAMLFKQKMLRNDTSCRTNLGPIDVNRDSTFLVRKEEKRLREKMKSMHSSLTDNDSLFIRRDKLLLNGKVIDSVDISNQVF
jgi:hypothetical protein